MSYDYSENILVQESVGRFFKKELGNSQMIFILFYANFKMD